MKLLALNQKILVLIVAGLALTACGKKSEEQAADAAAKGAAPAAPAAEPAAAPVKPGVEEELKHYATAVESGKSSAPVDLRYDVPAKPEVGSASSPNPTRTAQVPTTRARRPHW